MAAMVDATRGTNYAVQIQNIPDDTLAKWYGGVPTSFSAARLGSPTRSGFSLSNSISPAGISSVNPPDLSLFPPGYGSGPNWSGLVSEANSDGLMPATYDASTRCDPNQVAKWGVILATMTGIQEAADAISEAIPDETVIVLGEGTTIPAKEICCGVALVLTVFNQFAEIYEAYCDEIGGIVTAPASGTWRSAR